MDEIYGDLKDPLQLRCLTLTQGDYGDSIRAKLRVLSLENCPKYDALSYVWGIETASSPMLLDGTAFTITKNLDIALRHIRQSTSDRTLWVDAVCINQRNPQERAAQVKLMRRIYSSASTVLVWLGPAEEGSDDIMKSIQRFDKQHWQTYEFECGLMNILYRPWFTRIWVIQEFVLGKSPRVGCGAVWVTWISFMYAWSEFRLDAGQINARFNSELSIAVAKTFEPSWVGRILEDGIALKPAMRYGIISYLTNTYKEHELASMGFYKTSDLLQSVEECPAQWTARYTVLNYHRFESPLAKIFMRKCELRAIIPLGYYEFLSSSRGILLNRKSLSMTSIVKGTMNLRSTDPRDKIYGILGLVSETARESIPVDYEKSPEWAFVPAMEYMINHEPDALVLLGLLWRTRRPFQMSFPSWVPDFTISADWGDSHSPIFLRGSCVDATWKWSREAKVSNDHTTLSASGLCFGKVKQLVEITDGDIESYVNQLRHLESIVADDCPLHEPLWRTLIGIRNTSEEFDADEPFNKQFTTFIGLLENQEESLTAVGSACNMFNTIIQDHVRGRIFFTTDMGFAGISTPDLKIGDDIGLVFGMRRVAVLRQVRPSDMGINSELGDHDAIFHRIVAFAYVGCHNRAEFKNLKNDGLTDWTRHSCFQNRDCVRFHII